MKTVREIMSPVVITLKASMFLPEAASALQKHGISGAPVVDRDGNYIGFLSQTDVSAELAGSATDKASFQAILEGDLPSDLDSIQVKEVMTTGILKISADASLEELGQSLIQAGVHRLLATDGDEIVGLVSTTDLVHTFIYSDKKETEAAPKSSERRPYLYENEVVQENGITKLTTTNGAVMDLEPPQEFGGSGKLVSPEELFIASINSCLSMTFREFARAARIGVNSYSCRAVGRLEGDGTSLRFARVDLYPEIEVNSGSEKRTEQILDQAKLRCLVGRSVDVVAVIHPKIVVKG